LRKFIAVLDTPTGRIVMADRAALRAQEALGDQDAGTLWEQFVATRFERSPAGWQIRAERAAELADFARSVQTGLTDCRQVGGVFQEVASKLAGGSEQAAVLKRFLNHEAAPAYAYARELRARLHPDVENLAETLGELLVRTESGTYVIRPARRAQATQRLAFVDRLTPVIARLHQELLAWSTDLADADQEHRDFAAVLADPRFAEYAALQEVGEDSRVSEEDLEGVFWRLEEATNDAAAGLLLNRESDQYRELQEQFQRFTAIWEGRDTLREPLDRMLAQLEERDELHRRLKAFLASDLGLLAVARERDYSPVTAAEAAREMLAYWVTKNDAGQYEITVENPDELAYMLQEFFQQHRELRRRGRATDEFAAELQDPQLRGALQSFLGKLLLRDHLERTAARPDLDGLALWFESHFEETPEGLKLYDWAGDVLRQIIDEAAAIEAELGKADF